MSSTTTSLLISRGTLGLSLTSGICNDQYTAMKKLARKLCVCDGISNGSRAKILTQNSCGTVFGSAWMHPQFVHYIVYDPVCHVIGMVQSHTATKYCKTSATMTLTAQLPTKSESSNTNTYVFWCVVLCSTRPM